MSLFESKPVFRNEQSIVHLFADARGYPPRLAAVLVIDGEILYTDWAPPPAMMKFFKYREDNQTLGLELLAIALGLSTFANQLQERRIHVWSDNTGSEHGTSKGRARSWDHCCIIHSLWTHALLLRLEMFVYRVPTDDNIADLPSREEYSMQVRP